MKQVQIFTSSIKQYRVMEGERIVSHSTEEDRMYDTISYKTVQAQIQIRDIGTRGWKGYVRIAIETVERAKEVCEMLVRNDDFVGPMLPRVKKPATALV